MCFGRQDAGEGEAVGRFLLQERARFLLLIGENPKNDDLGTKVMISTRELRHIIECGFLPLSCTCTANPDGSLMIKVFDPESGCVELLVAGILIANLGSTRSIANLIDELRGEMATRKTVFARELGRGAKTA